MCKVAMSSRRIDFTNESLRFPPKTRHLKKILNFILTRVGLLCTVCLYLLAGAFLFQRLESKHELKQQGLMQQQRINCLKELWIITEKLNVLYAKNWTQLAHQHIRTYEEHVSELTANFNGVDEILNPHQRWTFIRSFHYSLSLMTTIGNAGLSPKTLQGKLFTILYAILGIPLMFLLLSNCGYLIADGLKLICFRLNWYFYTSDSKVFLHDQESTISIVPAAKQTIVELQNGSGTATTTLATERKLKSMNTCCQSFESIRLHDLKPSTKSRDKSLKNFKLSNCSTVCKNYMDRVRFISTEIPAILAVLLLFSYINLGSVALSVWKDYSFLDASFFWFFSLTTIGQKDNNYVQSNEITYSSNANFICYLCIFTIIGLIITASVFVTLIDKNFLRCNLICSNFHQEQNVHL